MTIPYYHVDSFTSRLFAGNPAGLCIVPDFLSDELMLKIAAENRHSATGFVMLRPEGDLALRWFTPRSELDLCGHATLAAAYVLELRDHSKWPVNFRTRSGLVTVKRSGKHFVMDFPARPAQECEAPDLLPNALGVRPTEVLRSRDYVVVVDREEQVREAKPDISALAQLELEDGGVILTAAGDGDADYVARFFAPALGVDEDPATGSINCTLAPYWSARLRRNRMSVMQLSPRGGELHCEMAGERVRIGGEAKLYLKGEIEL